MQYVIYLVKKYALVKFVCHLITTKWICQGNIDLCNI